MLKWTPKILSGATYAAQNLSPLIGAESLSYSNVSSAFAGVGNAVGTIGDVLKETHDTSELSGASGGSVLWSQQILDSFVQVRQVREEYARIIDNYFSMFGYKVCRLRVPNISARPSWNFVKCSAVTLTGAIPADAEELIMNVFKKGVTFWKTTFGNYSANNK